MFGRQHGGGSLMVWREICFNVQIPVTFLSGRQKSENYQETLADNLFPSGEILGGTDWTFQHDKASVHASNSTSQCLRSYIVSVLNWPALSSDFHPIENVVGILTSSVYQNDKIYSLAEKLRVTVEDA
ncbi:Transposable element Tc3 transposase [Araneus ventricosus]|uniref:Transposable element Tc3 transposase n=1 Tax=Araneus ventricosus TaxID=182803 RepID=A0A4Y2FSN4_ARAVE|nr:Transposable element Tc3 transposase [Araneus ventricosus]